MATETLTISEESLIEVVWVIRAGVEAATSDGHAPVISNQVERELLKWCDEIEKYWTNSISNDH